VDDLTILTTSSPKSYQPREAYVKTINRLFVVRGRFEVFQKPQAESNLP